MFLSVTWTDAGTLLPIGGPTGSDDIGVGDGANDLIDGLAGNDQLSGGGGDDTIVAGDGDDMIDGGTGTDTIDLSAGAAGVTIDLTQNGVAQNLGSLGTDTLSNLESVIGTAQADTFQFVSPADGVAYTVDGCAATDLIDLSAVNSSDVTFLNGQLNISSGGINYSIAYSNVESIQFADALAVVVDGTLVGHNITGAGIVIDQGVAVKIDAGANSVTVDYDGSDELHVTSAGAAGVITIDSLAATDAVVGSVDIRGDIGGLTSDVDIDAITADEDADLGTITIDGGAGQINSISYDAGQTIGSLLSVNADVGTISGYKFTTDIDVVGDVTLVSIANDLEADLTVTGNLGDLTVGNRVMDNAQIQISGTLGDVTVGGAFRAGALLSAQSAGTIDITGEVLAGTQLNFAGDVTTVDLGGSLYGTLTVGGNLGLVDIDDDLEAGAGINITGTLGTLDIFGGMGAGTTVSAASATSLSVGADMLAGSAFNITGNVTTLNVGVGMYGDLTSGGNVGTITIGDDLETGGDITIAGTVGNVSTGGGWSANATLSAVSAGIISIGWEMGLGASIEIDGNVTSLLVGEAMSGNVTIGGDLGTFTTGLHLRTDGSLDVAGHLGTATLNGDIRADAYLRTATAGSVTITQYVETDGLLNIQGGATLIDIFGVNGDVEIYGDVTTYINQQDISGTIVVGGDVNSFYVGNRFKPSGLVHLYGDVATFETDGIMDAGAALLISGDLDLLDAADGDLRSGVNLVALEVLGPITVHDGGSTFNQPAATVSLAFYDGDSLTVIAYPPGTVFGPTDLALSAASVDEDAAAGTVVGNASAVPSESTGFYQYSLLDDAGARFEIDRWSGAIAVASPANLDFATNATHTVTVQVVDCRGNLYDEDFVITVNDVNLAPSGITFTGLNVNEGVAVGFSLGSVVPVDADPGETFTFQLTDDAGGLFAIDTNDGEVTVAGFLDFDDASSRDIAIRVTDSGANQYDETVTINIANQNLPVTGVTLVGLSVNEDAVIGTLVGTASGVDADDGETFAYALTNDGGGRFSIDPNTGALTVAASLDHETADQITVSISATDSGANVFTDSFTVSVNDINEPATGVTVGPILAEPNAGPGTDVGFVVPLDTDAGESWTYSLLNDAGGTFVIDPTSGMLRVAGGSVLGEAGTTYAMVVRFTDSGANTTDFALTLTLPVTIFFEETSVPEFADELLNRWSELEFQTSAGGGPGGDGDSPLQLLTNAAPGISVGLSSVTADPYDGKIGWAASGGVQELAEPAEKPDSEKPDSDPNADERSAPNASKKGPSESAPTDPSPDGQSDPDAPEPGPDASKIESQKASPQVGRLDRFWNRLWSVSPLS